MRNLKAIFLTLSLLLFLSPVSSANAKNVALKAVTFQQGGEKGETVRFVLSGELQAKTGMMHGNKPRLVVNFYYTDCSRNVGRNIAVNGKLIKRIRVGIHTEKPPFTSVVLDLVPGGEYRYVRTFEPKDNILLITVLPKKKHAQVAQGAKQQPRSIAESSTVKEKSEPPSSTTKKLIRESAAKKSQKDNNAAKLETKTGKGAQGGGKMSESANQKAAAESGKSKEGGKEELKSIIEVKKQMKPEQKSASSPSSSLKKGPFIQTVSFEKTTRKGEMVMFKLNDFYPPKVFGEENGTPRVICDFPNARLSNEVKANIICNGTFVKSVQITKQTKPDKVRVVLNLIPNKNYNLQQVFFKEDNLFVIIVNSQDVLQGGKAMPSSKI